MNVKVGDFGLAALIETPGDRKKTICGTPNYIAPEVLFDTANGHSFEVDTWSIGVILYTLLIGKPPFQTNDVKTIYERIKKNNYEFPVTKPISPDAQALITDILTHDPRKRPSLHQIIEHDFFTKGTFPASIPVSAHEYPPSFADVTRQQSKINYMRVRRAVLLDAEETEIRTVDIPDSGSQLDAATVQQQQKQEREFHKAVQPGSPISVLLRSAREPLLVSKSPLRASHHARENMPPPSFAPSGNTLMRKLSAVAPKPSAGPLLSSSNTPLPLPANLDEEDLAPTERVSRRPRSGTSSTNSMPPPAPLVPKASLSSKNRSPVRQPLQSLPTLQEEQDEARRQYDLASQKARIVSQMAAGNEDENGDIVTGTAPSRRSVRGEREQRDRKEREPVSIPVGKGLADEETEGIKPIRETPRKLGRSRKANVSTQSIPGARLQGYEEFAHNFGSACRAVEEQTPWRTEEADAKPNPPRVYIQSWVDYCNKYGMGYALTNGCVGVHFNDSTSMVLAADKHHFDYLSSRRNGAAYVRKNYTIDDHPSELKSKVYLLRHFERYMLDRLLGESEHQVEDAHKTSELPFVHKYLRMTNVLLFKLSHDVLQFNFFDHTKLIVANGGMDLLYIDKHGDHHVRSLTTVVEDAIASATLSDEARKFNTKLLRKITFCKDLLAHILAHTHGSRVEDTGLGLDPQ
ncbi:Pkinase-domain-containing protein [Clavulina sp. PMI_390]|nr:Pkinase-domain-containing protein [Clavulina sp. PMI_390]